MERVVIRRWVQLVMLPLLVLALWALARAAGTLFLVLIVACLVALVLAPMVGLGSRVMPRGLAILLAYLVVIGLIAVVGVALASPVATQVVRFEQHLPQYTRGANRDLASLQRTLRHHHLNVHITGQGQSAISSVQKDLLKRSGAIVNFSRGLVSSVVRVGVDLILILVLSLYMLVYAGEIGALARRIMPPGAGGEDDYPRQVQHAVSGYVRGQLLLSFLMGAAVAIVVYVFSVLGLFPAGGDYFWFFGTFYGLMEFIPYLGPILGPVPVLVVALFQHPISALYLLIVFVILQQIEGHVVTPQVFRISLRINPILIILALLIGDRLYGIVGALVALPVIAVIRTTVVYLHAHTRLETWGRPATAPGSTGVSLGPPPGDPG